MKQRFDARLRALETLERQQGPADHCFVSYIDDDPPRYFVDGLEVEQAEWMRRADLAGASSYVIQVEQSDGIDAL